MSFYPIRTYVTVAGANVTGVNFQMGRTVSGTVTLNGAGLPFVTVSTNTGVTATTLSNGSFSLTGLGPGTYTVTPNRAGYTFTPASRSVTVATVNITGINFTATQTAAPVMGGGDDPGDTSGDTQPGGPMRPDEAEVYYGQDGEAGTMASPGGTEETAGETTGATGSEEILELAPEPVPGALQNLKAFFYAWDHLGTIRLVSNSDRSVMERHDYEPFGVELRPILNQTENTHQFTGHERDQASGMDYMHFRFYGSNMGRFMKPDNGVDQTPMNPQSWNLYSYVRGNPVNFNDPTGHWSGEYHKAMTFIAFLLCDQSEENAAAAAEANVSVDSNPATDPLTNGIEVRRRYHGFPGEDESWGDAVAREERDNPMTPGMSAEDIGKALHPIQDPYVHGQYESGLHGLQGDSTTQNSVRAVEAYDSTVRALQRSGLKVNGAKAAASRELLDLIKTHKVGCKTVRNADGKPEIMLTKTLGKGKAYLRALKLQREIASKSSGDAPPASK
jgi:RHS repeat-associated protein